MIAVSNTTPLRYLIATGYKNLLGQLFEKVFVPPAVHAELTDERTPEPVRNFVLSNPAWYEVREIRERIPFTFPVALHAGEGEAILLAEELRPDVVLIDEQTGRTIALSRKLPVMGTLGVLVRADKTGMIANFPEVLERLKSSGFFIAESLHKQLLERHQARGNAK